MNRVLCPHSATVLDIPRWFHCLHTILIQYSSDSQSIEYSPAVRCLGSRGQIKLSEVGRIASLGGCCSDSCLLVWAAGSLHSNLTSTGGGQWVSEDRQHLLFLHRLTPIPHQLLLSWFVPYLSSLVGQHPNEVTSLTMSCDSHTAYITSRSRFLDSSRSS